MKECPSCGRRYDEPAQFCPLDGTRLVMPAEGQSEAAAAPAEAAERLIPPPPEPVALRLTIVDQGDEGNRSRVISGRALDLGEQGMRIQTGTVETGQLNIIRDHTVAFKNKLDIELDLPNGTVRCQGFAAWYKPAGDGISWLVGVYIRDMPAADRRVYDEYLNQLAGKELFKTAEDEEVEEEEV